MKAYNAVLIYHQKREQIQPIPTYHIEYKHDPKLMRGTHEHAGDVEISPLDPSMHDITDESIRKRMEEAYILSQRDIFRTGSNWASKPRRSSMVGDIFVDQRTDSYWVVLDVGFVRI